LIRETMVVVSTNQFSIRTRLLYNCTNKDLIINTLNPAIRCKNMVKIRPINKKTYLMHFSVTFYKIYIPNVYNS